MHALQYEVVLGNALGRFCGTGKILCKSYPYQTQHEFCAQGTKMSKERDDLKTNEMSRQKVSNETSSTKRGLKTEV